MSPLTSAIQVIAKPDEMLDALVWRALGKAAGAIERVLDANPSLSGRGHVLPAGTIVIIPPEADTPVQSDLIQLWD